MELVAPSKDQALADLAWAMSTPSLVGGNGVVGPIAVDLSLVDVEHLGAFVAERPGHRVGRYFESLIHYWLLHIENVEMVANGLQIMDGTRTVGELDFLFRDKDGVLNHWEAAVKFFLHYPRSDGSHFPGPNARDSFEKKTNQLFNKQLALSKEHYPDVQVRKAFVRGQIFGRLGQPEPSDLPELLADGHQQGKWLRRSELERMSSTYENSIGHIVMKPLWLSPILNANLVSMSELCAQLGDHFAASEHPMMISLRNQDHTERQRLFVVSNHWPEGNGQA